MEDCDNKQLRFCTERFNDVAKKLDNILSLLGGREGLIVDVDRLKQSHRKQARIIWIILGGVATGLITALFEYAR